MTDSKEASNNPKADRACCNFLSFFGIFSSNNNTNANQNDPGPAPTTGGGGLNLNRSFSDEDSQVSEGEDKVGDIGKSTFSKQLKGKAPRTSVSAEAYGQFNKKENFVPKQIKKNPEQTARIRDKLMKSFLFSNLDSKEFETVVLALEEKSAQKDEVIIRQYEDGENLYIVDSGTFLCRRRTKKDDPEEAFVKNYSAGEAFGELALLYNAPRAATIICSSETGNLFVLDRGTFNHIVKDAAVKKREKYEGFLGKIEILHSMSPYERITIADALKASNHKKDEFVFKQGDKGDCFYMIMEGEAVALKKLKEGEQEQIVFEYKEGDYFGELALLKDEARAASIKAKTELKLASLDISSFKRLMGPVEELLKRNEERYKKFVLNSHK